MDVENIMDGENMSQTIQS